MGLFRRKPRPDDQAKLEVLHVSRQSMQDLKDMAHQMQAAVQAMQTQQEQQGGGTVGSLLSALGMDWSSDYIKRVVCPVCGGPKKRPSPSAYVYCDYCGSLADFDFRTACSDQALKLPGPEYRNLIAGAQPRLQAAKSSGDRDQYAAIQREIFDGYATNVPKACSHRIADPTYKAAYVEYMAQTTTACDFDPEYSAVMEEMSAAVRNMTWTGTLYSRKTGGPSFWALVEVVQRQQARGRAVTADLVAIDPDHASDEVRAQLANSMFCQGWLPMLEDDDARRLVEDMKLGGEYTKAEPLTEGDARKCGGCGADVTALPGATHMVCDHCGRSLDVGGAQSPCPGCGGRLTFPTGMAHLACPFCGTDNERVGLT